jgi:DNA-binding CsgD family transcriptional regulator/tetratricopeptide (TPR) repeat protein
MIAGVVSTDVERGAFVGRDRESARLGEALALTTSGTGQVLIVGGEAGIGKTRLFERFAAHVEARGGAVVAGSCLPLGGSRLPYAPVAEALRDLIRSTEPGRLPALLGPGRHELRRLLPELGRPTPRDAPAGQGDRHGQLRLFEAVADLVERLAQDRRVVFAIDDVQWADVGTRALVLYLVRSLSRIPVLVVLLVRTDEPDPGDATLRFLAELQREPAVSRLDLGPLSAAATLDLARTLAPGVRVEDLHSLVERSSGNPFFLEQLSTTAGGDTERRERQPLGPTLRDVLAARMADLPARTRQVLRAAAAAGRRVDDGLLVDVLGAPVDEVAEALRVALARGILVDADGVDDGRGGYAFRHSLLRETAYAELLFGERERLHSAFARALEVRGSIGGVAVSPGEIAFHWIAAGDATRALPAAVRAGFAAEAVYAFADARRWFEQALQLWPAEPAEATRLGAALDGLDRAELLRRAADAAVLAGDYDGAVQLGRRAIAALDASGSAPDRQRSGALLERLRWYLWESGETAAAEAAVEEALRVLPEHPPSAARARAMAHRAGLRLTAGDAAGAAEPAARALAIAREAGAAGEEALALGVLGWVVAASGRVDEGVATIRSALAIAERLGSVEGIALGHANLAEVLDRVGRTRESLEVATTGLGIARSLGAVRTYGAVLAGHAAKALFDLGRWSDARARAEEGLELDPVGAAGVLLNIVAARIATSEGRVDEAARHLEAARRFVDLPGRGRTSLPRLLAADAELAAHRGEAAAVERVLGEAAEMLRDDRPPEPALGWVAWFALRLEADRAAEPSRRREGPEGRVADRPFARLLEPLLDRFADAPAGERRAPAIVHLCRAEIARAEGRATGSTWDAVADEWDAIGRPAIVAYARYRAAEGRLVAGERATAAEDLRRAWRMAVQLGAVPLRQEIEILGRHARVELGAGAPPAGDDEVDLRIRLGLTPREVEILPLLTAGLSNQQIADVLFVTRKTASVHVSNLIGKLGGENRVQAAAFARRLGLVDDAAVDEALRAASPDVPPPAMLP